MCEHKRKEFSSVSPSFPFMRRPAFILLTEACFLFVFSSLWVKYVYFMYIFFNPFYVFSMMYYLWLYYIHFQFLKSQVRQEFLPSLVCSVYYDTFAGWVKIYKHMGECKYYHYYLLNVHITYLYPFLTIFIYCVLIKLVEL